MAQKQVAALIEGNVYQGMFFWLQAAPLLRPSSRVQRVVIEHDQASGVDDIAVFYAEPGIDDCGRACSADFFQVKYHVDRSAEYSALNLCDPKFIRASRSLLQRFHDAHMKLQREYRWYRLNLVSNWQWASNDPLAPLLRESLSGALPERFLSDGPRSALGKARKEWREHLGMPKNEFDDFARRLRFGVNFFGRQQFRAWLSDRLARHGLREIPEDQAQNIYDSLAQQFVMNGTNEFDAESFRAMCEREGLLSDSKLCGPSVLGIRSFMRFAERMEDECERFVCIAKHFDRRYIRQAELWHGAVLPEVRALLADPALRSEEHHLLLDCHSSLAFLAGYELDRKSGAQVFPVQKGIRTSVWKPSDPSGTSGIDSGWNRTRTDFSSGGPDVAIAVSVTRDVADDVRAYVAKCNPTIGFLIHAHPTAGIGAQSVAGADHAIALADKLADLIRSIRPRNGGTTHLFIAAPNAVMFFLGQHRAALGKIQLYEFDFDGERGGSYSPSLRLPE